MVLRLEDGRYAFYEHLRPGSVIVRPGQHLRRGLVLGALGFSGSSTGPHLHFHVADDPSPTGAEGRPFALDGFDQLGRYSDLIYNGLPGPLKRSPVGRLVTAGGTT